MYWRRRRSVAPGGPLGPGDKADPTCVPRTRNYFHTRDMGRVKRGRIGGCIGDAPARSWTEIAPLAAGDCPLSLLIGLFPAAAQERIISRSFD